MTATPAIGTSFDRRVRNLGIAQARTPFRSPRANAIAERWVRSVRIECLDHVFIFNERHLQKVLGEYIGYFNHWRPHRSIGQRAPCAPATPAPRRSAQGRKVIAIPVLGGLHHVYQLAADVLDQILAPYRMAGGADGATATALWPGQEHTRLP